MTSHPHEGSRFCMQCGGRLVTKRPPGDTRDRLVCEDCGFVHYLNPRPVAGILPVREDGKILLERRAIEPRMGTWVFPGGFMDLGETAEEAGIRETMEEAHLKVTDLRLLAVYTRVEPGVVVIVYTARAIGDAEAADETSEVRWFGPDEIPWDELSFDTTHQALHAWLEQR